MSSEPFTCDWCDDNGPLEQHEILRGCLRKLARDQACATLWLCRPCHSLMGCRDWAEQLAILRRERPECYNLWDFHAIAKRNKPEESEVRLWLRRYGVLGNDATISEIVRE